MSKPVWLFVCYGGGHVKALLPVALRVRELGVAQPMVLALTTAAPAVRASGLRTLGFRDFLDPADQRARTRGEELTAQLAVQATDRDESVAYLGLSYTDMEDRLGAVQAAELYRQYGRQAFLPLSVLQRVIRRCQAALVVTTNSPRAERAAIEAARSLGVPSVCLVDLLGIWERDLLGRPDYADAVCVLNEGVRDSLLAAGRPAGDVHVTGNPAFDTLRDPEIMALGARYRDALDWTDLHVLLYASSPEPIRVQGVAGVGDPAFPRQVEDVLVQSVRDNPALALWVRRHPSEARASYIARAGHARIRESTPDLPLHAFIHASDEVVVTVSTVGVEASLAGKAVTQVTGSILDHLSPYLEMGLASRALDLAQLAQSYRTGKPAGLVPAASKPASSGHDATEQVVRVLLAVQGQGDGR